jgi:hypoxanthine phosphoribosyltransferase
MPKLRDGALISAAKIAERIDEIAALINKQQKGRELTVIGILKGSFIFTADLVRRLKCPVRIEFIRVTMEEDSATNSRKIEFYSDFDIEGKDVLILEDVLDTGITLDFLREHMKSHKPASIKMCALLDKIHSHKINITADYTGFEIGNEFVVGYGLDYNENYRELPYIGIMEGATWALADDD